MNTKFYIVSIATLEGKIYKVDWMAEVTHDAGEVTIAAGVSILENEREFVGAVAADVIADVVEHHGGDDFIATLEEGHRDNLEMERIENALVDQDPNDLIDPIIWTPSE